jgi:hypothetical protein
MVRKGQIESCQVRARLPPHPDYTTRLWYGITALRAALLLLLLLLLMKDNGGSEMGCAGWLEGWLDVLTT